MTITGKKSTAKKKSPAAKKAAPAAGATMATIRAAAKALGIPSFGKTKKELIRAIQRAEGNFDCYGTATSGYCDQTGCAWYSDCLKESVP
jgi:hypothetical protein